jgi:hypothetical protein
MSGGIERLLRRMISPEADQRCTASQAMTDEYWTVDMDLDLLNEKLMTMSSPPGKTPTKSRKPDIPPRPFSVNKENKEKTRSLNTRKSPLAESKSTS